MAINFNSSILGMIWFLIQILWMPPVTLANLRIRTRPKRKSWFCLLTMEAVDCQSVVASNTEESAEMVPAIGSGALGRPPNPNRGGGGGWCGRRGREEKVTCWAAEHFHGLMSRRRSLSSGEHRVSAWCPHRRSRRRRKGRVDAERAVRASEEEIGVEGGDSFDLGWVESTLPILSLSISTRRGKLLKPNREKGKGNILAFYPLKKIIIQIYSTQKYQNLSEFS